MAPTIGASQNSHSWEIAQSPTITAGPVLRAGFTDVFVTGMPISLSSKAKKTGMKRSQGTTDGIEKKGEGLMSTTWGEQAAIELSGNPRFVHSVKRRQHGR